MEDYDKAGQAASRAVMTTYSTSFGLASKSFPAAIRQDIYDIYGLVRVADEIVDTYDGGDRLALLDELEQETYAALQRGFSTNLIVHAFQRTARRVSIDKTLIEPFFASMRIDVEPAAYRPTQYEAYIYGSAEVIGLMCLKIFCNGNGEQYARLKPGAQSLGAAFQKINFLRDIAADHAQLGRYYFPTGSFAGFNNTIKDDIIADIRTDLTDALPALNQLPSAVAAPVATAYAYYDELLNKLAATPADQLKMSRPRISDGRKLWLLVTTRLRYLVR